MFDGQFQVKATTIINVMMVFFYFSGIIMSFVISIKWMNDGTFLYSKDKAVDFFSNAFSEMILLPIEVFFAFLVWFNCCCSCRCCQSKCAAKFFIYAAAIISLCTIINYIISTIATRPTRCEQFLNHSERMTNEAITRCFNYNGKNAAVLVYYTITHVLFFLYLRATNYGLPQDAETQSIPLVEDEQHVYVQVPATIPVTQQVNYNQFY